MAGRNRLLTPDLAEELATKVAAGVTLEQATAELGLSSRSVRRWRAEGERELAGLSAEAKLALGLDRARDRADVEVEPWQDAAARLAANDAALTELLRGFDEE
jgi:hypothetical protein